MSISLNVTKPHGRQVWSSGCSGRCDRGVWPRRRRKRSIAMLRRRKARSSGTHRRHGAGLGDRESLRGRDRREGRTVSVGRVGRPAPISAGDRGRARRCRRPDNVGSGSLRVDGAQGTFVSFKPQNSTSCRSRPARRTDTWFAQRLNIMTIYRAPTRSPDGRAEDME